MALDRPDYARRRAAPRFDQRPGFPIFDLDARGMSYRSQVKTVLPTPLRVDTAIVRVGVSWIRREVRALVSRHRCSSPGTLVSSF
jgi:hypothetical protein